MDPDARCGVMADQQISTIPIPDPTLLTTEQLRRELSNLRELMESKMSALADVHGERFKGVDARFSAGETALAAALLSQKDLGAAHIHATTEAAGKAEAAFTKQVDALGERISEIKERLDRGEGSSGGVRLAQTDTRASMGQLMTAGSLVLLAISIVISAIALHH
jgi:Trk K+ transport system NAD-binding subunit